MTQAVETGNGPAVVEWPVPRATVRLPARLMRLGTEIAKFASVGAIAFVIDVGLFNLLRADLLMDSPLTAKTISVLIATVFAYMANRHWTYRHRPRTGARRESALFLLTNAAALLISWACLATTHYLLGLDSQLADNISGNGIALALGTAFRFYVYRTWVFPEGSDTAVVLDFTGPAAADPTPAADSDTGPIPVVAAS